MQMSWAAADVFIFMLEKWDTGADSYWNVQKHMKIQYMRQKLSLYKSNEH